jgi:MoaA/NifB/PqqE/SkfB family radical SAM enzyme
LHSDILRVESKYPSILSFEWNIIDKCQQKCSYCSSVDFNNFSLDNYDKWKIAIFKLKSISSNFKVDLVGGEPTLHPQITDIINELTSIDNLTVLDICSNMRSPLSLYENLNYEKLSITASHHIEYNNKGFKEKVLALTNLGIDISMNINLLPDKKYWSDIIDLISYCESNNIRYGFNMLNETSNFKPDYSSDFFSTFDKFISISNNEKFISHFFLDRVELLSEFDLFKKNIDYSGLSCSPKQFLINLDSEIINDCSFEKFTSFDLNNIIKEIKCPHKMCENQIKYNYPKYRK